MINVGNDNFTIPNSLSSECTNPLMPNTYEHIFVQNTVTVEAFDWIDASQLHFDIPLYLFLENPVARFPSSPHPPLDTNDSFLQHMMGLHSSPSTPSIVSSDDSNTSPPPSPRPRSRISIRQQ